MLSTIIKFIKRHLVSTFLCLIMIAGVAVGNLTSHTEALLDTLLATIDPTGDGSASAVSLIADIDDTPVDEETTAPISSNWAYDHAASTTAHDTIYVNKTQGFTAFTGSDLSPDVSGGEFFETATATDIDTFDDGGDSSTLYDGQMVVVQCLHAGSFDFTGEGLTSPYGEDFTMIVGATEVFMYDLSNTTWKWLTPKAPSAAVSENGFIARTAAGTAAARTITGTANEITVTNGDGSGDPTLSLPASIDLGGKTLEIPNGAADVALAAAGQLHLNTTDEQLSFHSAADGEISGEAALSLIQHRVVTFDPDAVCDGAVDRLFLMTIGDDAPEGIIITEWKLSFEADPTTEADIDLKYADAFIGVANAAVVDVCDTTNGASSEDTNANINSGNAIANGKVLYLEFGTAYTETTHQIIFEWWYYAEED